MIVTPLLNLRGLSAKDATKMLLDAVSQGEGVRLEYKSSFQKEVIEALAAFANTQDGAILVGVSDTGKMAGVTVFNEVAKRATINTDGGVNGGVSGGVNGGVNGLLSYIQSHPGQRSIEMVGALNIPLRTIVRWLKQLKETEKIEFRGATRTGGYYCLDADQ